MPDFRASGDKEQVGAFNACCWGQGRGLGFGGIPRGQAFALLGIEHGVAFEERDFPDLLRTFFIGLCTGYTVGIYDEFAMLALAHIAAELQRLFEGEP